MAYSDQKTVVLEVAFAKQQAAQPILDRLLKAGLSSAIVLRGRVTPSDAWFELELKGSTRTVDAVLYENQEEFLSSTRFSPKRA